jgi:hypothetical protein
MLLVALAGNVAADTAVYQVAASADDALANTNGYYSNIAYTYWPNQYSANQYMGFMRWAVNIPKTAGYNTIIDSAYLSTAGYTGDGNVTTVRIRLIESDSCAAFTSNPRSWSVSSAYVDASSRYVNWLNWYSAPQDLKTLVQAFVNRAGYASGNYLGLRGEGLDGSSVATRVASYDQSATYAPKLTVTWHQELINQPPVADAGDDQMVEDTDDNGVQAVTLDGTGSTDGGSIVNYVWSEGATQLATGSTASVNLSLGTHEITLTVTDDGSSTDTDTVLVTVTEPERVREYTIEISADDSVVYSSENGTTYTEMSWPYSSDAIKTFMRYELRIPKGATITEAYLNVRSNGSSGGATSVLRLQAVDSDNCPEFRSGVYANNPFTWTLGGPTVDTTYGATWTANEWYASADISDIVQDFIDREDYEVGHFIGLCGSRVSGAYKRIYGWDYGDHTSGPKLVIHYTGGDHTMELWMADPEVRLGQKIYCQIYERSATDTLRVKLDGNVVDTVSAPLAAEEVVTVDYRDLDAGEHTLLVEMVSADNTVQTSASRTWTKLHEGIAAVAIDENNAICRDGVPFFPVTSWCIGANEFATFEGQINTLCGQGFNDPKNVDGWVDYLESSMNAGLAVIGPALGDYWPGGYTNTLVEVPPGSQNYIRLRELDPERMAEYIEASKDCPELLFYEWHDEPDLGDGDQYIPATEVRKWTDLGHEMDTEHPHYLNVVGYSYTHADPYPNAHNASAQAFCFLYSTRRSSATGNEEVFDKRTLCTDIMAFDYYPYEMANLSYVSLPDLALALDRMRLWNYNLIPHMTWIETCDVGGSGTPNPPTPTELNQLVWLSIIHGVKGINWFHYFGATPAENRAIMEKTVQWTTVLAPAILSAPENVTWTVSEQEMSSERVDIMTREIDSRLYIFAAHMIRSGSGETVRFNVTGLPSNATIGVVGEGRTITSSAGYFEDTFSPLAVHIYTYPALATMAPVAKAGVDRSVTDSDFSGSEAVTLTEAGSFDADGTISSYVWKEGATQIATGSSASVTLSTGEHTITLVVTDNASATGSDTVTIIVNPPPVADAGDDQSVNDTDNDGYATITLDGGDSTDSLGEIVSYVWTEGGNTIATGETATHSFLAGTHTVTLTVTDDDGATDTDTVQITVVNANVVNVQYQIAASTSDCYALSSESLYSSTTYYFPYNNSDRRVFLRWPLTIPDGATILNATLQVKSNGGKGDAYPTVARLQLVDSDSCAAFNTNPFTRSVTATYVDWTLPGAWTSGTWYMSGDVSSLVQEFIDRAGYASGNYLGLRCVNASGMYKQAYQWDNGSHTDGAILSVTYLP